MGSANVLLRTLTSCRSDFAIGSQLGVHTADSDDDCTKSEDTANIVRRLNSGTLRLSRSKRPTIDDLQAEHAAFIGPPPPPQIAKFTPEDSRDWTCTGFVPVWCSC
jgi:hypothetical protein